MKIHAISTGRVKITKRWQVGDEHSPLRLLKAITDSEYTDWLPIFCFVIEHPEGLIVVDSGILANANDRVWIPPFMPLLQRAAPFDISSEEEIGPKMRQKGFQPEDVRWLIQTHLHLDHEGGFHYFPNAEVLVSRNEWEAASGWKGRLNGYLNFRWPKELQPTLIDFDSGPYYSFEHCQRVTQAGDIVLVPTPGHSAGHLSVIVEEPDQFVMLAGDVAYSQALLLADEVDGVAVSTADLHQSHRRILELAQEIPTVFVPSHEWAGAERLDRREKIFGTTQLPANQPN